jgi:hypothetical protein
MTMSDRVPAARTVVLLLGLTLATQLASLAWDAGQRFVDLLLPSIVAIIVITAPLAALGIRLGRPIGLGTPLLDSLLSRRPGAWARLRRDAVIAATLGLLLGGALLVLRVLLEPVLPDALPDLGHRGPVGGLLVSASAAVSEEAWLRLGVMTLVAALFVSVGKGDSLRPIAAWSAILIAAVGFGMLHLPQLAAAGAATPAGIIGTMAGNTLVGTLCGWLYWRRSFLAAVFAHFATDIVLHVLPALVPMAT